MTRDGADQLVSVTARTLLRELSLFPDRLAPRAEVDSQLITLLPGETHVFRVLGVPEAEAARLCSPPVLTCVRRRSK